MKPDEIDELLRELGARQRIVKIPESSGFVDERAQRLTDCHRRCAAAIRKLREERDEAREEERSSTISLGAFALEFGTFEQAKADRDRLAARVRELEAELPLLRSQVEIDAERRREHYEKVRELEAENERLVRSVADWVTRSSDLRAEYEALRKS